MFGRHYESMYTGSMIGAGSVVFAVWGYAISHMRPPAFEVELNAKLLAFILGDSEEDIIHAIEWLCTPDEKSRSKAEEGRRLVRRGEYLFYVVNGETYNSIRNDAEKKAYWRDQKKRQRMAAEIVKELEPAAPPAAKGKTKQFTKPTREELNVAAEKLGLPSIEVDKFVNHFESNGWKISGKAPMKSWQAALANWKIRFDENRPGAKPKPLPESNQIQEVIHVRTLNT